MRRCCCVITIAFIFSIIRIIIMILLICVCQSVQTLPAGSGGGWRSSKIQPKVFKRCHSEYRTSMLTVNGWLQSCTCEVLHHMDFISGQQTFFQVNTLQGCSAACAATHHPAPDAVLSGLPTLSEMSPLSLIFSQHVQPHSYRFTCFLHFSTVVCFLNY